MCGELHYFRRCIFSPWRIQGLCNHHSRIGCTDTGRLWAWLAGSAIAFSYVASLYIHPLGARFFAFPAGDRNDPVEIRSRFRRVFYASIFSLFISGAFQCTFSGDKPDSVRELLGRLGFRWDGLLNAAVIPVGLTLVLFLGPLVGDYCMGRFQGYNRAFVSLFCHNRYYRGRILRDSVGSLIWWRAYVVAPLSGLWVFLRWFIVYLAYLFVYKNCQAEIPWSSWHIKTFSSLPRVCSRSFDWLIDWIPSFGIFITYVKATVICWTSNFFLTFILLKLHRRAYFLI